MIGYVIFAIAAVAVIARTYHLEARERAAIDAEPLVLDESPEIAKRLAAAREYCDRHRLTPCYSSHFRILPDTEPNVEIARAMVDRPKPVESNARHAEIAARVRAKHALSGPVASERIQ